MPRYGRDNNRACGAVGCFARDAKADRLEPYVYHQPLTK